MPPEILTADDFAERLSSAVLPGQRPVVFLLGSGLCLPNAEGLGVPGTRAIIGLIAEELGGDWSPVESYQDAFSQLICKRGEDAANRVVRRAVLQARVDKSNHSHSKLSDDDLETLEAGNDAWHVPPGILALASLSAHFSKCFGRAILTTNFDPLIEVGLSRQLADFMSSALHADGSLLYLSGSGTHVVHLHGYWRGSDTLHTQTQLSPDRSQLADSLRHLLGSATLAVVGYGGWDDIFMKTLASVVAGNSVKTDILWGFHEADGSAIEARYGHVLSSLAPAGRRGRALFYKGIATDTLFCDAFQRATDRRPAQDVETFLRRVELTRTGRVRYPGLATPWSSPDTSLGNYAKLLAAFEPAMPTKIALFAVEYLLPGLERQYVHAAPVKSEKYGYVRESVGRAFKLLASFDSSDETWLSGAVLNLTQDSERAETDADGKTLQSAANAVASALACVSSSGTYSEYSASALAARALHTAARVIHDDDGALWGYVSRRLGGGPDHLWRFR